MKILIGKLFFGKHGTIKNHSKSPIKPINHHPDHTFISHSNNKMRNLNNRLNTYGPRFGRCNICLSDGPLTEDHIPPKGSYRPTQVDLLHITDLLTVDRPISNRKNSRHLQSGLSYRILCPNCNNNLLGTKYDPALATFARSTHNFLQTPFAVPRAPSVRIQPGLVARAILGHLFAVGLNRTERTPLLTAAQEFVLDDSLPLPDGIDIRYWIYPYRWVVAIRDAGLMTDFFKSKPIVFWLLKFFPLGFMVTLQLENPRRLNLPSLRTYMLNAGTHYAEVPLPLVGIPHQFWPEAPNDDGAVLFGDAALGAIPRNPVNSV